MTNAKLTRLSQGQRQTLAKRHLSGESLHDLEGYAGLDHSQLYNLFKQQGMRDLMATEQGYYDLAAARGRLKLHMSLDDACDEQIGLLKSEHEEMRYKASRFIIESTLPQTKKLVGEVNVWHHAEIEVLASLTDAVSEARLVPNKTNGEQSFDKYVLIGTEGIETVSDEPELEKEKNPESQPGDSPKILEQDHSREAS